MRLLILLLIVSLPAGFATGHPQETAKQDEHFEIVMYEGFPAESLPVEFRKELKPEKPLLIAPVAEDGKFKAEMNGAMFEGTLKSVKDKKLEITVTQSQLYSTSSFLIKGVVKLNGAVFGRAYAFSSIIFSYYFRVRRRTDNSQKSFAVEDKPKKP